MTRVTAIIVNWNAGRHLLDCVESLRSEALSDFLDIVVVDNASSDGSVIDLRTMFPDTRIVEHSTNVGFAAANNIGLAHARLSEYTLMLNPDAVMNPDALKCLVRELDEHPDVAAVGPRLVGPDGSLQATCARRDLTLLTLFFEVTGLRRLFPRNRLIGAYRMEDWDHRDARDVDALSGACMLIRRTALRGEFFLDETIPMYFEDIDFCRRLREEGWRVRFLGQTEVLHHGRVSSEQSPQRVRLAVMEQGDARWLFFRRYGGPVDAALAAWILGGGALLRIVVLNSVAILQRVMNRPRGQIIALRAKYLALLKWALRPGKPHMTSL